MSVFTLSPEETVKHWPEFRHHIERLERETGLVLASSIRADLASGAKQVWGWQEGVITGVAITEVIQTPKGPCCWVYGGVGTETTKGQIDAIIATIEAWAKGIGCSRVMLQGRRGWLRRLSEYKQVGIILEKEV